MLSGEQKRFIAISVPTVAGGVLFLGTLVYCYCCCRKKREEQRDAQIAVKAVEVVEAAHAVIAEEGSGFHVIVEVQPPLEGVPGEIGGI